MGTVSQLTNRSVLKLEGADATSFLQDIITQDMDLLLSQRSIYTSLLTPQGKILFDFFIFNFDSFYLIDCAQVSAQDLMMRLTMYKLRAQIDISDVSAHYSVVVDLENSYDFPTDPRCPELGGRMIIDKSLAEPDNRDVYDIKRIALGIADSHEIGSGQYFPHECNLDQLNGVSFSKGCFVGQEVVSRMHHRTTARSRILPFTSQGTGIIKDEEVICDGRMLGQVISFNKGQGLALLRLDRIAKLDTSSPFIIGSSVIDIYKPHWANFETENIRIAIK